MVRKTSLEAYNLIKENGLLSKRRMEIYFALYEHGPCTANELFKKTKGFNGVVQANLHARLGEMRDLGVVEEVTERVCGVTGRLVIVWDVTDRIPFKLDKPVKHRCKACGGSGYITEQQTRMF